ncbi:MAG: hypothetical protein LBI31_00015 [Zoogloeaceae bacterium]|nr:hypothetical protein [Zoogloeaceae bacterium]
MTRRKTDRLPVYHGRHAKNGALCVVMPGNVKASDVSGGKARATGTDGVALSLPPYGL